MQIKYFLKGTRSEGMHGVLLKDGKVVRPKVENEEIETELGVMKYCGDFEKRKML